MAHKKEIIYYAESGEFVTLDNKPYIGPFHVMSSGIMMTGKTHTDDSEVIVLTKDRKSETAKPLQEPTPNTVLDENQTEYDLMPELINSPPIIIKSIGEASEPQVKPSSAAEQLDGNYMYQFPDGTVKVHAGTSIILRIDADQPKIFNVENGVLELKQPEEDLTYQWFVDGEVIVSDDIDYTLRAQRLLRGNALQIVNFIPRYAGTYTCIASNDVGSADGGSLNLEVYNSDVDSFFYTNLIKNPNGLSEDGALGIGGWESLTGKMTAKRLDPKTDGARDKRIVVDPMNPNFRWTQEMMNPKPYQLDGGVLQQNPLRNLQSYFTRERYDYRVNGGVGYTQMYQDIDVTDLHDFIRGSVYGVEGVTALISFYLGNAIWAYEPARPYLAPNERANPDNYWEGAARLSPQNFSKMGPGFVKEIAQVHFEEYNNNTRLPKQNGDPNPQIFTDPWNKRFSKYRGQIYYPGGEGMLLPDNPSSGGGVDHMLFVADELMPLQKDRYTYGQYAEFNRLIIPRLHPSTNKIRIVYTIKATGQLFFILNESTPLIKNQKGIYELPGWAGSWPANALSSNSDQPSNLPAVQKSPHEATKARFRTSLTYPDQNSQRFPKQSKSRAFATGFNVTLIPTGPAQQNQSAISSIHSINTRVQGLVPSPIEPEIFLPLDDGRRSLTVGFVMNVNNGRLDIQITEAKVSTDNNNDAEQVDYVPGLFPFDDNSNVTYLKSKTGGFRTVSELRHQEVYSGIVYPNVPKSSGPFCPIYLDDGPSNGQNEGDADRYVQLGAGSVPALRLIGNPGQSGYSINQAAAPIYRENIYTIPKPSRLEMYQRYRSQSADPLTMGESYTHWALQNKPLVVSDLLAAWKGLSGYYTNNTEDFTTTDIVWSKSSRFVVTIGVHDLTLSPDDEASLYSINSYYFDFEGDSVTIHKNRNTADNAVLPSFDDTELATEDELEKLQKTYASTSSSPFSPGYQTKKALIFNRDVDRIGNQLKARTNLNQPTDPAPVGSRRVFSYKRAKSVNMDPIIIPLSINSGDADSIASIQIPEELLVRSVSAGGLGVPQTTLDSSNLEAVNIVQAVNNILQAGTNLDSFTELEYNLQTSLKVLDAQIAVEREKVNVIPTQTDLNGPGSFTLGPKRFPSRLSAAGIASERLRWYDTLDFKLEPQAYSNKTLLPKVQAAIMAGIPQSSFLFASSDNVKHLQTRKPPSNTKTDALTILLYRKYYIEQVYNSLIAIGEWSEGPSTPPSLTSYVTLNKDIAETEARVFVDLSNDSPPLPKYKAVLYGVRPINAGTGETIATPLAGEVEGKDYTLEKITVANKNDTSTTSTQESKLPARK